MKTYKFMIVHNGDYNDYQKARKLKEELESESIPEPSELAKGYIEKHPSWKPYDKVEVFLASNDSDPMNFRGFRVNKVYVSEKVGMESINVRQIFIPMLNQFDSDPRPILF